VDNMRAAWLYPIILAAGALQAWGPPMNSALKKALTNPWLSSLVSFVPIVSLAIDKYGWFGMSVHELSSGRIAGAALLVAGIVLICRF
jgi:uncharacterized membrane protein YdcZ (DUF606 family)